MSRAILLTAVTAALMLAIPLSDAWGRGRGGGGRGGFSGGGRGGFSGGGFSGGASRNVGGFSGGAMRSPRTMGSSMPSRNPSGFGSSAMRSPGGGPSRGPGGMGQVGGRSGGPGAARANLGSRPGAGIAGNRPSTGARPAAGNRPVAGAGAIGGQNRSQFTAPSSGQLNSFLGLPSDQGLHRLSSDARPSGRSTASQLPAGGQFDVNSGTAEGPRGGQAGGVTVTGPRGNTAGRAVGVGSEGGVAGVGGVQGAGGGSAVRGAAVGPDGKVAAGRAAVGPGGFGGGSAVAAGPGGVAAGFTRVSPSGRYSAAAAVRTNYNHWGIYGGNWYTDHPGAWFAAGWASSAAWRACTWNSAATYVGYTETAPVYYDYGNNITYQDDVVYMNGDEVGTSEEYYEQAASLATTGAEADAPADGDWLPLGVFALTKPDKAQSSVTIQLAVNKDGVIRGNYTDTNTDKTQLIQGSIDKQTQRAAFTVGDDTTHLIETGLYNLTKDESPCLLHFGSERTEQWLLVRLQDPESSGK